MADAQKSTEELVKDNWKNKINKKFKWYKDQINDESDNEKKKKLKNDLDKRVNDAAEILSSIDPDHSPNLVASDGSLFANYFDGLVNYSITVLRLKNDSEDEWSDESEDELEPCVSVSCKALGRGYIDYKYKDEENYIEDKKIRYQAFAELFDWVIERTNNKLACDNRGLSDDDIDIKVSSGLNWSNRLRKNPDSSFIKLIARRFPDISETDKEEYYHADKKGKIVNVDPLKILRNLDEIDYSFERELRQLIILLAAKKTDDELKTFFKCDQETEGPENEAGEDLKCDEIASMENQSEDDDEPAEESPVSYDEEQVYGDDYNNSLMNECICFGKAKTELCNDEKELLGFVGEVLESKGKKNVEVFIDDKGVIKYIFEENDNDICGYIGQVFLSDSKLIKTRFRVNNYWFVPEYRAYMEKISAKNNGSLEQRTVLSGYVQQLKKLLYLRMIADLEKIDKNTIEVGTATSLNGIYRKLFEARFQYDFLAPDGDKQIKAHNNLDLETRKLIVETLSRKVRYPDFFSEGSTSINALIGDEKPGKENEYFHKNENIYLIDGTKGYFDPEATSSGKTQGSARYLVEGAKVNPDGTISPSEDKNDRTPIFKHGFLSEYSKYNPFDRNQMVFSNLMRAYEITEPVGTALMTCGGWNMEDAFVVSKKFAEEHPVPNNHPDKKYPGPTRPLKVGDKMLDRGGNKGVISAIIDPDGNDESLSELQQLFHDNPELQVIASPYSGLSRFNGATARELMESSSDLLYQGKHENCIGKARYIITRQFADVKTKIYDEKRYLKGESRQASAQLSWALCSKDAREMLRCLYKESKRSETDLKEFASLAAVAYGSAHSNKIFEAVRPNQKNDDELIQKKKEEIDKLLNRKDGCLISVNFGGGSKLYVRILPMSCRPGYTDSLGRYIESDVTKLYRDLLMSNTEEEASKVYRSIKRQLLHVFSGKDNIFKTRLMTRSVKYSATAIWTPDPRLPIESIAISSEIAKGLNVKKGNHLLIWRDPVLRDSNVRYMKVERVDDNLTGIAINPVMAKGFDGDFDGDTVAVVKISYDTKAHEEAVKKFSVKNNLFDEGRTKRPLCINTKLDLVSAGKAKELEQVQKDFVDNKTDSEETLEKINKILRSAFKSDYCLENAMIRFKDDESVLVSMQKFSDEGDQAKKGNIGNYKKYFENKANNSLNDERTEVQKATAIKAAVGIAGRYSQQLMRAFREICPKAVLELTYPNTQALLQIKHDPEKAVKVYKLLKNELMPAWEMTQDGRIDRIKELYDKDHLDQPIGEDGINEKYLRDIDGAMGDRPLSKCHGTYLDERAYPIHSNSGKTSKTIKKTARSLSDYITFKCSTDKLANNKDFLVEAVTKNSEIIRCLSRDTIDIHYDKDIYLAAVKKNGLALRHIGNSIADVFPEKTALEIVREAVSNCSYAYKYVPRDMKNDEVIIKAVNENQECRAEEKVYEGFNSDPVIVKEAVNQYGMALQYAPDFQSDPEIVKIAVAQDCMALKYAPDFQSDPEIVKIAVAQNGRALQYAPDFQSDPEIVKIAVAQDGRALQYAPDFQSDPEIVKIAVAQNGWALQYAPDFQSDPEIVKIAVAQDGMALKHAPDFQNDPAIVKIAVAQKGEALKYAVPKLKKDPEIVKIAISQDGKALEFAEKYQDDPEIVKIAVAQDGRALQYAPDFQSDPEIVKIAVAQDGMALKYAPDLQDDPIIERIAFSQNAHALQYAPDLQRDLETVRAAVALDGLLLKYAPDFQNDPEIVKIAVAQNGMALQYAPDFQNDPEIVKIAIAQNGRALGFAPDLQDDPIIERIAFSQNAHALQYAPDLQRDPETVRAAVTLDGLLLKYAPDFQNDPEIVKIAVAQNGMALQYAPDFQSDPEIALIAVKQDGSLLHLLTDNVKNDKGQLITETSDSYLAMKNASEEEKNNRDFVLRAVEKDGSALELASDNLKNDRQIVLAAISNDYRALKYACENRYSDCFIFDTRIFIRIFEGTDYD